MAAIAFDPAASLAAKEGLPKEGLLQPGHVDQMLDFAKMHRVLQAASTSAIPQTSVEAVDGGEALVEQRQREEAARRRTLILGNIPRHATERQISAAVDVAAGTKDCISRSWIVRDNDGTPAGYGFFEFKDTSSASDAVEASRRGQVVIEDEAGYTWNLRASYPATGRAGRRARRRRSQAAGSEGGADDAEQVAFPPLPVVR